MSSGVAYPPPTYPPVSIFNSPNYPPIPTTTTTTNNFSNGINLTGTSGSARTITGISNLDFISNNNTNPSSSLLTQISQNDTQMIIGTQAPAGTIEIDIYGSALKFNGIAVGTGSGNVNTANSNTYANGTTQTFYNAGVNGNLSFNSNGTILMSQFSAVNTSHLYFPNVFPTTTNTNNGLGLFWDYTNAGGEVDMICYGQGGLGGFNFYNNTANDAPFLITSILPNNITLGTSDYNINITGNNGDLILSSEGSSTLDFIITAGNQDLNLEGSFINLLGEVNLDSIIEFPNITPTTANGLLINGYGTFFQNNGTPYFMYNNNNTITNQQLPTLSVTNFFQSYNCNPLNLAFPTTSTIPANSATFYSHTPSGTPFPYFSATDGTTMLTYQLATLSTANIFTLPNTFPYITLVSQSNPPSGTNNLYTYGGNLFYGTGNQIANIYNPVFTGNPRAPTPPIGDNSTSIATTAFINNSGLLPTILTSTQGTNSWVFNFPANANYGNSFRFVIYTNGAPVAQVYGGTSSVQLTTNNSYGIITGNGTIQEFVFSNYGIPAIGYLCSSINSIGAGLSLGGTFANYPNTWSLNVNCSTTLSLQSLSISIFSTS
jgi:hypothetical protein